MAADVELEFGKGKNSLCGNKVSLQPTYTNTHFQTLEGTEELGDSLRENPWSAGYSILELVPVLSWETGTHLPPHHFTQAGQ